MKYFYQLTTSIIAIIAIVTPFIITSSNNRYKLKMELQKRKLDLVTEDLNTKTEAFKSFLTAESQVFSEKNQKSKSVLTTSIINILPYLSKDDRVVFKHFEFDPNRNYLDECVTIISEKLIEISQEKQQLLNNKNNRICTLLRRHRHD